jgi:hypothetical protein
VCQADENCETQSHPGPLHCGCPDCNKPHPPHFQNSYCENLKNSTVTSEATSDESSTLDKSDSSSGGQKASRLFNPFVMVGVAAALALVGAAILMQKRVSLLNRF